MPKIQTSFFAIALLACGPGVVAQTVDPVWDGPERLSTVDGSVSDRSIAVDSRGRSHAFWVEDRLFEGAHRVQYARFGGKTWTVPAVRLYERLPSFPGGMSDVEAVIDSTDVIHVIWHGRGGPVQHSSVAADRALSPSAWSEPAEIPLPALKSKLMLSGQGQLVIVYSPIPDSAHPEQFGVVSVRSSDNGRTWSQPVQIDTGVPAGSEVLDFDADDDGAGGIHAVWTYRAEGGYQVRTIRYARSLDGGMTWSTPKAIETATDEDGYAIRLAVPEIKASGPNVHIVYAGGGENRIGRRHLYSANSGATFTVPKTIFEGLEGSAGADSSYFDSAGRFHLFAQLGFPIGVYHSVWENGRWSEPSRIYLIAEDAEDVIGTRINARGFEATVSSDDRVVLLLESCGGFCEDNSSLPANPMMFALSSIIPPSAAPVFTSVSSATFIADQPLAPAMIAAGFGQSLNGRIALASEVPLPTSLDGVEIEVMDAANQAHAAGIQFVSPQQLNYVVPEASAPGLARVRVRHEGELIAAGTVMIGTVAPSIYTVNGQGTGVAAATWLFVAKNGRRTSGFVFDPATRRPLPVSFDPAQGDLYLTIYGTGLRGYERQARAEVGKRIAPILSIGPQGQFEGLDQVNIGPLPRELAPGGIYEVVLTVDGLQSNRPTFTIE